MGALANHRVCEAAGRMKKKRNPSQHKISGQFAPRTIEMLRLLKTFRGVEPDRTMASLARVEIEFASHGGRGTASCRSRIRI